MEFPAKFTQEFIKRTNINLEFVRKAHSENKSVNEVTQLINSMLGLLVFPKAEYYPEIDSTKTLDTFKRNNWNIPDPHLWEKQKQDPEQWKCLQGFMRHMRNGLAHKRIEFHSEDDKELSGLTIWDQPDDKPETKKIWEVKFTTIEQLCEFTQGMIDYFLNLCSE